MLRAALLLATLLLGLPAQSEIAGTHRVSAGDQRIELTQAAGFLQDASARLAAAEVAALAGTGAMKTVPHPRIPLFHLDQGQAWWLKVDVAPDASAPRDWLLEVARANIDSVQVFTRANDGRWTGYPEVGAARPFAARVLNHRHFVYPVRLDPGSAASFLVRIRYAGPSAPMVTLWQPAALHAADRAMLGFGAMYFGLVTGMLLYNLLLYLAVKDAGYLLYAGCVACTAGAFAGASGLGAQFAWGDLGPWTARLMYAFYGGALLFSASLTRQFLKTRERLPIVDKALRVVALGAVGGMAVALLLPSNLAAMALVPLGLACAVLVPGAAVAGVRRGWPGARFFCAAWGAMYTGVLVVLGRTFALLPANILTENSLAIGSAFEMILLSLALADRINDEKRQKEQAQSLSMAVLQASQALGAEPRLDRLHARVCEIVAGLSGATSVRLVLRDADLAAWFLFHDGQRLPLGQAAERGLIPPRAVQRIEQTPGLFVTEEGVTVLPISHQGAVTALLVLDNSASGGELPAAARAAIGGIAGPLAVTLENVLLYDRLEQHVAARTQELRATQEALVATARRAGMAEIATNVLHNVGNTLNSVNVAAELIRARVAHTRAASLTRAVDLLEAHRGDLAGFFERDAKGRILPGYLRELDETLGRERLELQQHIDHLVASIDHIKKVVATQQAYAGPSVLTERVLVDQLVDDALRIAGNSLQGQGIEVVKEVADIPPVRLDKTRALQILVNLVDNAAHAMGQPGARGRGLTVQAEAGEAALRLRVRDSGGGIAAADLTRIFSHGFTTRPGGHGFGLHSCALAASEMGGTLTAQSDGPGTGATFTLELPLVMA